MQDTLPRFDWTRLDDLMDRARPGRTRSRLACLAVAWSGVAAVWWLVWSTGGTQGAYLHAAYLPILFAGATMGLSAASATAVLAAVALGPLMPLDVGSGTAQSTASWLYRGAFFVLVGGIAGAGFAVVRARARRNEELRNDLASIYSRNLRVFAGLVEGRDEQTYGHCDRVARNSVAIGRHLGLNERTLGRLYWAGLLHDLGKIGVPEDILRKPGPLTDDEFRTMQGHCELGRTILLDVSEDFGPIADGLLAHHERWDGSGYPHGRKGEEIPLFGRIVAVADVFEALTSHRPYREPLSREEALEVLHEGRGTHFDPQVHDAFLKALQRDEIGYETDDPREAQTFVRGILRPDAIGLDLISDAAAWRPNGRPS